MLFQILIAGFTIGILGSFHCVGMCGPIALTLPVQDASPLKRLGVISLYNLGRVLAYAVIGAIFGVVGKQFFIGGYQQSLSIALGVLLLLFFFFSSATFIRIRLFERFTTWLKQRLGQLMTGEKKSYTFLLIGFLNGFLPCGLVYVAVAGAVATGAIWKSALFMAGFGMKTFPIMFMITILGKYISVQWRNTMRRMVPVFIVLMAVLLILRGLNLGIPYLSPEMKKTESGTESCCHKKH